MKHMKKLAGMFLILFLLSACSVREGADTKIRDIDFTVLSVEEVPTEFLDFIYTKQEDPFRLTYTTDEYLYVAVGYGMQPTGGYSISVKEFYLTENAIQLDTELIGPSVSEGSIPAESYPFLVLKTEKMDKIVVFN